MLPMIAYCMVAFTISMAFHVAYARDPGLLQDFCVGVNDTQSGGLFVNGFFCKNPMDVTPEDFLFRGFDTVGNTSNRLGSLARMVNASAFPALNTMGITLARIDFATNGVNPLHLHPRASEMLTVLEGTLLAGFVTSNLPSGANRLYSKVITKGDIFVFPQGLTHFQLNIGGTAAVAHAAFGSQSPGLVTVARAVFGSMPLIPNDVLAKSFQVDESVIEALRSQFVSDAEFLDFGDLFRTKNAA